MTSSGSPLRKPCFSLDSVGFLATPALLLAALSLVLSSSARLPTDSLT